MKIQLETYHNTVPLENSECYSKPVAKIGLKSKTNVSMYPPLPFKQIQVVLGIPTLTCLCTSSIAIYKQRLPSDA